MCEHCVNTEQLVWFADSLGYADKVPVNNGLINKSYTKLNTSSIPLSEQMLLQKHTITHIHAPFSQANNIKQLINKIPFIVWEAFEGAETALSIFQITDFTQ